ncbi:DNA helicase IV [Enterobacteriaceae bacterium LUAb1]
MELKATSPGRHLSRHPYNRVRLLNAGVEVSGEKHQYLIPFSQLVSAICRRGMIWGELEFLLPDNQVVRLHGTKWQETQRFYHYFECAWKKWSQEMSDICAQVLTQQAAILTAVSEQNCWLKKRTLKALQQDIDNMLTALPLPVVRLTDFASCAKNYQLCRSWLEQGETNRQMHNALWCERVRQQDADFFSTIEETALNAAQINAVVNGEESLLVQAGAGSGKTSILVARTGWLLKQREATKEQILLLAFGPQAAEEMTARMMVKLHTPELVAQTFPSLALHIIQQGSHKTPKVSALEMDGVKRRTFLVDCWRRQCQEKKTQASGWHQWLSEELGWAVNNGAFWLDDNLAARLAPRLECWLSLIRMHRTTQADMIASVPESIRNRFSQRIRLMSPLLKAWKSALKAEGAMDFSGLIQQAINLLEKGRFISPWKHILIDEFQDLSPQYAALIRALRQQNTHISLFAAGDDWQAIYRFSGAERKLITTFHHYFGEGEHCVLDTTYRFNDRIGKIANDFIQHNPCHTPKALNSFTKGDKQSVVLLREDLLDNLLDKLSGYVKPEARILILARYYHLQPAVLDKAKIRWPKLRIDFMTIHASKGQQADYVIVCGLRDGTDGFPAPVRESVIEEGLLPPPERFPDAPEHRLAYVAMTRARRQVWFLYNAKHPSSFVNILKKLGVVVLRKP